jgi:hypothetical protein
VSSLIIAASRASSPSTGVPPSADLLEEEEGMIEKTLKVFSKKCRNISKNVGENILENDGSNVFSKQCWYNSFLKMLVQLFMKNICSTFCLKNVIMIWWDGWKIINNKFR